MDLGEILPFVALLFFSLSLFHSSFIFLQYIDGFGERPRSYQRVALYDIKSGIGIGSVLLLKSRIMNNKINCNGGGCNSYSG